MTYQEAIEEYEAKAGEQGMLLFAHYGKAIYVAQVLEQKAINMLAIDDLIKNKPDSPEAYEALWAKYDHSKKMVGVMATLLQDAYQINEDDMTELKEVLGWRNNLSQRYFRFNDVLLSSDIGRKRMVKDFVDFANSVSAIDTKLNTYVTHYDTAAGVSAGSIKQLLAERKEKWKDTVIDDTYDSSIHTNDY